MGIPPTPPRVGACAPSLTIRFDSEQLKSIVSAIESAAQGSDSPDEAEDAADIVVHNLDVLAGEAPELARAVFLQHYACSYPLPDDETFPAMRVPSGTYVNGLALLCWLLGLPNDAIEPINPDGVLKGFRLRDTEGDPNADR